MTKKQGSFLGSLIGKRRRRINRYPSKARRSSVSDVVQKNTLSEVASIIVFAVATFCLISLVSFNPSDPSFFSNVTGPASNACGRLGAYLSALFLHSFGVGAFIIPAALFFLSTNIYKREGMVRFFGILAGMSVAVMSLTVFAALQWEYWSFQGAKMLTGGAFGVWVGEQLLGPFNILGSSIIAVLVFTVAIVLSTPISVAYWGAHLSQVVFRLVTRIMKVGVGYGVYYTGVVLSALAGRSLAFSRQCAQGAYSSARNRLEVFRSAREQQLLESSAEKVIVEPTWEESEDEFEEECASDLDEAYEDDEEEVFEEEYEEPQVSLASEAGGPTIHSKLKVPELKVKGVKEKRDGWKLPSLEFLKRAPRIDSAVDRERLIENSQILQQKFADFGIEGEITAVRPGPVITLYEFKPGPGIKVSKIASLSDDLSMALSAESVRILAPLPGKSVVGIEIPSDHRETVFLREVLQQDEFFNGKNEIPTVLGKDISGQPVLADLARMPHLLVAGQTGSGKSVFMNDLICSMLYRFTPEELRLILVDPKFIEFRAYQDIPHLLLPVVDDPKEAATSLRWAVREMERRYRILAMMGVRNLGSYNKKVEDLGEEAVADLMNEAIDEQPRLKSLSGSDWMEAFEKDDEGEPIVGKLPYVVIIIDELADLMMTAKKEVEVSIARISQKARAAGIHLVIATQRPSTDVVTGLIKANLPSRASFQLASHIDSKTILDRGGAERLLGHGDMLFIPPGTSQVARLHAAFVDDSEIDQITAFLKEQGAPDYRDEILLEADEEEDSDNPDVEDELFESAVELIVRTGHGSASFLQRHLKVGYNRAARLIEAMEARGIVGPADGARPREVLVDKT